MPATTPLTYPEMTMVRQKLPTSSLQNVSEAIVSSLSAGPATAGTLPGETVAVAVGSRGIRNIDRVVRHCLDFLKGKTLNPFIVPAMGSHGGSTADGQRAVLARLGITESSMEAPICPEMDVVQLGRLPNGLNIYFSKKAVQADHIVLINRIKPHTKFRAEIESGLCKMLTIGLGKAVGAAEFHRCAIRHTFRIIEDAARFLINQTPILFGLALLEDGYGNLAHVETVFPGALIERDKVLLPDAAAMMGRIPFESLDILIIDFIGKDISGIGMDSNITGRHRDIVGDFYTSPHVKRIFVRDLSPASDGNGNGIGLADFTTKRLVDALDIQKTYANALAAISPEKASIPMYFDTDRKSLEHCIQTTGMDSMATARIVRIRDTASLGLLQVSRVFESQISANPDLEQITPWEPLQFDNNDNLPEISYGSH